MTATESADAKKNTTNTENTAANTPVDRETITVDWSKSPESMTVPELQAAILAKLAGNGPVDAQMKKTVTDNIWHDSLANWLKSFSIKLRRNSQVHILQIGEHTPGYFFT